MTMKHIMKCLASYAVALFTAFSVNAEEHDAIAPLSDDGVAELLAELAAPDTEDWERIEKRIIDRWSKSGSRSMDLLLKRGRDALAKDETSTAIEHFTALTDHAPDFAEGWNARATAFFEIEEYGLSFTDISRALALNPNHFEAMTGLGIILEQWGEKEDALNVFREAQRLNPHREIINEAIDRLETEVSGRDI